MKVRTNLRSNLIYGGKLYVKNFMDEIEIPDNKPELIKYVKANPAIFPPVVVTAKSPTKKTVKTEE